MEMFLKDRLTDNLVVPFDDEVVERLEEVCKEYAQSAEVKEVISRITISILTNQPNFEIKCELEGNYSTKFGDTIHLPKCVMRALSAFIIYLMLENSEDIWNFMAARNCMVLCHGEFCSMPYPQLFLYIVEHTDRLLKEHSMLDYLYKKSFVEKIFKDELTSGDLAVDENKIILKNIARDAWYLRTQKMLKSSSANGNNSFEKVYQAMNSLVDSMPWELFNQQHLVQIQQMTLKTHQNKVSVRKIVEKTKPVVDESGALDKSSILLRVLSNENDELWNTPFMERTMSIKEFALYLYYELLLEKHYE